MRSLLIAALIAFGISTLATGCGSSSSSAAPAPVTKPGVDGPLDSGTKGVKGRVPKAP